MSVLQDLFLRGIAQNLRVDCGEAGDRQVHLCACPCLFLKLLRLGEFVDLIEGSPALVRQLVPALLASFRVVNVALLGLKRNLVGLGDDFAYQPLRQL